MNIFICMKLIELFHFFQFSLKFQIRSQVVEPRKNQAMKRMVVAKMTSKHIAPLVIRQK